MYACAFSEYGDPSFLRWQELPDPEPGPGEVTIAVAACGLNHLDLDSRAGFSPWQYSFPHVLGGEFAGTIAALGRGVEGWTVGDPVTCEPQYACGECAECRRWRGDLCSNFDYIGNDSWGGYDPAMPEVAAEFGAGLVCSHTGGARPRTRPFRVSYGTSTRGVVDDVIGEVSAAAQRAVAAGVARDRVLIDPTHDFGKNTFHGLALLRHMEDVVNTGWPVLMALSNKDFVGETLGVELTERLEGTLAATALAAAAGARMFRVHEVGPTRRVLEMVASIHGQRPPARTVRGLA